MPSADRPIAVPTTEATVWFIPDGTVELAAHRWFRDLDAHPEHARALLPDYPYLRANVGVTLVRPRGPGPPVLIDAGLGPVRTPRPPRGGSVAGAVTGGALRGNLAAIGLYPSDIDLICFTHLDDDHVGWLRHSDAFASIPLLVTSEEWEWISDRKRDELAARHPVNLAPAGEFRAAPVFAKAAAGHTPGALRICDRRSTVGNGHWGHDPLAHPGRLSQYPGHRRRRPGSSRRGPGKTGRRGRASRHTRRDITPVESSRPHRRGRGHVPMGARRWSTMKGSQPASPSMVPPPP